MKKNTIGIILLFIGVVLIASGILLPMIISSNSSGNDNKEKENNKKTDIVSNPNNNNLKKEQCLENLCINGLEINKQTNVYSISATIENKRENEIIDTAIKLIFVNKDGSTIQKIQYIQKLEQNQNTILEIQFTKEDESLMNVTSYKLEYATEQEKEDIKQNITD